MWSVMMIAMMVPSSMPMTMIFSIYNKKQKFSGNEFAAPWIFISGYILIWIFFSFLASILQFTLHNFLIINENMRIANPFLSGLVLVSAGIYQFTPLKRICLKNCQTPFGFIMGNWRKGKIGAFVMGLHHGLYCLGCCWVLMLILFVAGVMNLLWIALIAVFVFAEKIYSSLWFARAAGAAMVIAGILVAVF